MVKYDHPRVETWMCDSCPSVWGQRASVAPKAERFFGIEEVLGSNPSISLKAIGVVVTQEIPNLLTGVRFFHRLLSQHRNPGG